MADPFAEEKATAPTKASDAVKYWLDQVERAEKRERNWRKEARALNAIYEAENAQQVPYNILFSNTETLLPALYNSHPIPDTRAKRKGDDPTASAAAGLVDAYLKQFIDSGDARYCSFDKSIRSALQHALVPGRGPVRLHYSAEVEYEGEGDARQPSAIKDEICYVEALDYDKVLFGFAKTWEAVPWVAFVHDYTRAEAEEKWPFEVTSKLPFTRSEPEDDDSADKSEGEETCRCYEIWDKKQRKVCWVARGYKEYLEPSYDDPYRLQNFYPMPEPLQFFTRISGLLPVPLYRLYKRQAEELNKLTRRIDALIDGMKVRGAYDASVEGLNKILEGDDNELIALQILSHLGQGGSIEKAIWLVPIEAHVQVLQQLYLQRQQCKQVIFEIMGIADIMRGSSVASETLGAQEIKNKWGVLRLKQAQTHTANFIRDVLRLVTELAFTKIQPDTLYALTGSSLPRAAQMQQLEQQAQMAQLSGQPLPPEAQALLALPSFEEAVDLLKNDLYRNFNIDIETNSSIDAEATEDKESVMEFMGGFSQILTGLAPLVQEGILPFDAAKAILLGVAKKFRFGRDVEDELRKMTSPAQQGGEGQDAAAQQALMKEQQKLMQDQMKLQQDRMKFQLEQMKATLQQAKAGMQQEMQGERMKMAIEKLILQLEQTMEQAGAQADRTSMQLQSQADRAAFSIDSKANKFKAQQQQAKAQQQAAKAKSSPKEK